MSLETYTPGRLSQISKLFIRDPSNRLLVGVRAREDKKRDCQLDFLGGRKKLVDVDTEDTAVREGFEEGDLRFSKRDLRFFNFDYGVSKSTGGANVISYYELRVGSEVAYRPNRKEFVDMFFMTIPDILHDWEHDEQREMVRKYAATSFDLTNVVPVSPPREGQVQAYGLEALIPAV